MRKIKLAIASGKGGVGKSMVASSLAMLFAKNKKIVAVDCDVDAPNLHLWLGQGEDWNDVKRISVSERPIIDKNKCDLCGKCVEICAFDALKIFTPGALTPGVEESRVILGRNTPGVVLGTSGVSKKSVALNNFFCEGCGACEAVCPQKAITMKSIKNAEIRIKKDIHGFPLISAQLFPGETGSGKIVDKIKEKAEGFGHQLMVLDSPAGTGCPVIAALNGVDFVVLVTEPTPSGLSDLKRVLTVVNHFKISYGVVINKWDINKSLSGKIEKEFSGRMLGKISYDKRVFQAVASLKPILETNLPVKKEIENIYGNLKKIILKLDNGKEKT